MSERRQQYLATAAIGVVCLVYFLLVGGAGAIMSDAERAKVGTCTPSAVFCSAATPTVTAFQSAPPMKSDVGSRSRPTGPSPRPPGWPPR